MFDWLVSVGSVEGHGADFGVVPGSHLCSSAQSQQLASACFIHHSFFLTLVQKLLLSGGQCNGVSSSVFFHVLVEAEVLRSGVHSFVAFSIEETRPERRPCGHQKLLLVRLDIDDAVLVLHEVLEAGSGVHHRGDRHRRAHKTKE